MSWTFGSIAWLRARRSVPGRHRAHESGPSAVRPCAPAAWLAAARGHVRRGQRGHSEGRPGDPRGH
eukprot:12566213-Alexandrium_andersonii.AAC.1